MSLSPGHSRSLLGQPGQGAVFSKASISGTWKIDFLFQDNGAVVGRQRSELEKLSRNEMYQNGLEGSWKLDGVITNNPPGTTFLMPTPDFGSGRCLTWELVGVIGCECLGEPTTFRRFSAPNVCSIRPALVGKMGFPHSHGRSCKTMQ